LASRTDAGRALERAADDSKFPTSLSLVVVVGPPRSGTTWLYRELCDHDSAFPFLPECTLLTQQIALYDTTLRYSDRQRLVHFFSEPKILAAYYRASITRMLNLVVRINSEPRATRLVLKDSELSIYLEALKDLFPPHKVVALIRDPRDVLASMKNVAARKGGGWNVDDVATQLYNHYAKIESFKELAPSNAVFLRYEDLVSDGLAPVQKFLGLPAAARTGLNEDGNDHLKTRLDVADPFFSELYLQATTSKKIGSYKSVLSQEEIAKIESTYSGILHRWRY